MTERFDVCVVGAGMTGRLMALSLHHAGLKVEQVDRRAPAEPVIDGRTTALAYASVRLFKRLGLWKALQDEAAPIADILVSSGEPRAAFRSDVGLVVACDGRSSPLRALTKLPALKWNYPQTAIIFNVAHEKPHQGVAHEVFYPDGPFAILPMKDNHCSIVWTEQNKAAKAFLAMDDDAFRDAAQARIGDHLGHITLASERQSYPLSFLYAPRLVSERFVLAGDAAHGLHPIAGQGFNLGVKDVAALCQTLDDAKAAGLDIGHGSVLAGYDRWRRFDGASMALGTDVLNRLFSNRFGPLKHVRGLGLGVVQQSSAARRFFMRISGADLGELPALMQPIDQPTGP